MDEEIKARQEAGEIPFDEPTDEELASMEAEPLEHEPEPDVDLE